MSVLKMIARSRGPKKLSERVSKFAHEHAARVQLIERAKFHLSADRSQANKLNSRADAKEIEPLGNNLSSVRMFTI